MEVRLRYDDPGMETPDGGLPYRWSRFGSVEEALSQAAHDQARDGKSLNVVVMVDDEEQDVAAKLKEMTATERKRLEALGTGDEPELDPYMFLAGLSRGEIRKLKEAVNTL